MRTTVIYEDDAILVIYKPAGLAVQTAQLGQADCVSELKNYLHQKAPGSGEPYLAVIHRLDQPVEGLLVFAKNKAAANVKAVHKTYCAVVCTGPAGSAAGGGKESLAGGSDWVRLEDGIVRDAGTGKASIVPCPDGSRQGTDAQVKRAALSYRILTAAPDGTMAAAGGQTAFAEIELETGRFHQIRAQLSHHGMPILGDMKYATKESMELARKKNIRSVALCACRLQIMHPVTGEKMEWKCRPQNPAFRGMPVS